MACVIKGEGLLQLSSSTESTQDANEVKYEGDVRLGGYDLGNDHQEIL
jgi:hypothetical protein